MDNIRNFSIIAHIDHGKSTLSDRIIQMCGGLSDREMETRVLDSMEIERERGITIKSQSVTLHYKAYNDKIYQLNFIDTPGHVDFSYEVSRSLAACEGALLLVDAGQGVEAQTLDNFNTASKMGLKIIPVINKIDLPTANSYNVAKEIENIFGIDSSNIICCSAKTGVGIVDVLEKLIKDIPPPRGDPNAPLQALIIDSWFNDYTGVISLVCIKNGTLYKNDKIKIINDNKIYKIDSLGIFTPKRSERTKLVCGEVGWITCIIKDIKGIPIGATLTGAYREAKQSLQSFKKIQPQVYARLFPVNSNEYKLFQNALNKLSLNDPSLFYEPEKSNMMGFGFRCGFLGLLHMEVIQERLEREYKINIIVTAPTVVYEIETINKEIIYIDNPNKLPNLSKINELREPIVNCHIILPYKYIGNVISLCLEKRGIQINIEYYEKQVYLNYEIPMSEIIFDFFDRLKSTSNGYASLSYDFKYFKTANLIRLDILINKERIDELSIITHKNDAFYKGHKLIKTIQKLIPRQQFDIVIQATINNRIIASATVKQLRKNVIAKCYGGDVSRKKKLLQKQKEGKKRMKQIGNINLPQEVFLTILKFDKN